MKKALLVTTVSGFVPQFEKNNVRILQEMGYEVHYASNFKNPHYGTDNSRLSDMGMTCHQTDFVRSPFRFVKHVGAYRQLKKVMEENTFDIIHCHTPVGGVLGRLAGRTYRKTGTKVIYTAHGFHFYRGAPLKNWLFYYPVEWMLSRWTDVLITINEEDYQRAGHFPLPRDGKAEKINGVGIDREAYRNIHVDRDKKRGELGILPEEYLLLSVGELSKRKNHRAVIRALATEKSMVEKRKIRYLICGEGSERKSLEKLIKKEGLKRSVLMPGYRTDTREIMAVADCFIFPSKQEGLPVALMEAMAVGLPCICSDIRGNRDLVLGQNGCYLVSDDNQYTRYLRKVMTTDHKETKYRCMLNYDTVYVCQNMKEIYLKIESDKKQV